jgi:hypothetical protein
MCALSILEGLEYFLFNGRQACGGYTLADTAAFFIRKNDVD